MFRKWIAFGFLFGFLGVVAFVAGCGQSQQAATSTPTTQSVNVSGTVAASQTDLGQLGVTTLSIKSAGAADLTARGFTSQSVKAAGLVPMATSGTVITVGTLDASGTITRVATASVSADGSYSVDIPNYDTTLTYGAVVTKTDATRNKTLEMKVIYPAPTGGKIASSDAQVSPQTTLVAQMIIEKVVKVLESAKVDASVIANVKDAIISAVNTLITSGAITVTTVRDATATENQTMLEAADKAASNTTVSGKLDSIKGAFGLAKATDLASAKGAIFELFKIMVGDPRGIPEEIISAFATAYLNGTTKTVTEITDAVNNSLYDLTSKQSVKGTLTSTTVAQQVQLMITAAYADQLPAGTPAGLKSVVEAVFPRSEWLTKTISADTKFSVP
ncbi:hypothetical protein HZB08_01370, partial [Candidatus Saganbacteria bacterium]|nr:hypothetical protein [Candidatus Saganbacteria bacterium]